MRSVVNVIVFVVELISNRFFLLLVYDFIVLVIVIGGLIFI